MPKYLFTSDQRIATLPERIKEVASLVSSGQKIIDKSENNNATTLKFYYNLQTGTDVCSQATIDPVVAIRNFVKKFQFPNPRTDESLKDSINEGVILAPFRCVVSVLYRMALTNNGESDLSMDEILYFIFCDKDVCQDPTFTIDSVIRKINRARKRPDDWNLPQRIGGQIEWNQYQRQVNELLSVLKYASDCFSIKNRKVFFSIKGPNYSVDEERFIKSILEYNKYWYPSNPNDFDLSLKEYISYMDTKQSNYSIIDLSFLQNRDTVQTPENEPQVIYYGAPGTGKSYQLDQDIKGFDYQRTIFHPDSDYSSFVGCYKPVMKDDKIVYRFRAQAFIDAYVEAWLSDDPFYLVIEEINRGNCAQIFGDIFQLLDRKKGESDYAIVPDSDLEKYLYDTFHEATNQNIIKQLKRPVPQSIQDGKEMKLPANLYLRATMNTSDQSLFPMDSAFKRRWAWRHFSIKDEGKGYKIELDDKHRYDWWDTIKTLNLKIYGETKSADKQLGYWFAKLPNGQTRITKEDFVSKVLFYLWNDIFKDYNFDANNAFSEELQFDSFFTSEGKVDVQMVIKFMEKNGIPLSSPLGDEADEDEQE